MPHHSTNWWVSPRCSMKGLLGRYLTYGFKIVIMHRISSTTGDRQEGRIKQGRCSCKLKEVREQTHSCIVRCRHCTGLTLGKGSRQGLISPSLAPPEKPAPSLQKHAFHKSANSFLMYNLTINTATWGVMHPIREGSEVLRQQK